jgi:uncharacterized protein YecT (DUF1311 family)
MSGRDRTAEILEFKERNSIHPGFLSGNLALLGKQWQSSDRSSTAFPDFYLIRAVTILEVATRQQMASLIDHSKEYTDRAIEISKNIKMDFATVRDVQGRAITLGDIVAHSVPVNSFDQVLAYFEKLLGKPIGPLLASAVDRWITRIEGKPPKPIIPDYDQMARSLNRLFEIRHILCHELPQKPVYATEEVGAYLDSAQRFSKALEETLTFEKFGLVPLSMIEIKEEAGRKLKEAERELKELLAKVHVFLERRDKSPKPPGLEEVSLASCLEDAQAKWLEFRSASCDTVAGLYLGGTIMGFIWSSEAIRLTKSRTQELREWYLRESSR